MSVVRRETPFDFFKHVYFESGPFHYDCLGAKDVIASCFIGTTPDVYWYMRNDKSCPSIEEIVDWLNQQPLYRVTLRGDRCYFVCVVYRSIGECPWSSAPDDIMDAAFEANGLPESMALSTSWLWRGPGPLNFRRLGADFLNSLSRYNIVHLPTHIVVRKAAAKDDEQ